MYNALFCCDEVIIPTSASKKGIKGLTRLIKQIENVKNNGNKDLKIDGIFFSMVNEGTNVAKFVIEEVNERYGKDYYIFNTTIPFIKIFEETDLMGKVWVEYKPKHKCSIRYREFVDEFLNLEERG
jgi:chromosome partitioning protein